MASAMSSSLFFKNWPYLIAVLSLYCNGSCPCTTPSYGPSGQHSNNNSGYGYSKSNQQEKPVNVSVTLHGLVSKDQLYKIQEVLRHPSQYRDRIKPKDCPVKGKYATTFNKFCPKNVEVNEATVEEAIKYGQFLKKGKEDIAEAINIYKTYIRPAVYPIFHSL